MPSPRHGWSGRILAVGLLLAVSMIFVGASSHAESPVAPKSTGTYDKGKMEIPLHRGIAVPWELLVIATPDDCSGSMTLRLEWDEEANYVRAELVGKKALVPHIDVDRTAGVDYFPNPFWPEQEDIVGGRYQLWFITAAEPIDYYYDAETLDLLGSEHDLEAAPPGAIAVEVPTAKIVPTSFFQPDANGDVHFVYEVAYDHIVRGDRPDVAHHYVGYVPFNLCEYDPFRFDLSNIRPAITPPRPASEARTFGDYLRNGLIFDITVEPAVPYSDPPLSHMIGSWSNALVIGDGVPKGYTWDFDAALMNVTPPIAPWEGAGACTDWIKPPHLPNVVDVCAP